MAWGNKTSATQLTGITTTEQFFDAIVALAPTESVHFQISASGTPGGTDDLEIAVYSTLDDATETWDDVPVLPVSMSTTSSASARSLTLSGVYRFRVGVKSAGVTDTQVADMSYRIGTP